MMVLAVTERMHFKNVFQITYNPISHEIIVLRTNLSSLYVQVFNTITLIGKRVPLEIKELNDCEIRDVGHVFDFSYSEASDTFTIIARVTVKAADFEQQMWMLQFDNKGRMINKKRYEKLAFRHHCLMKDY